MDCEVIKQCLDKTSWVDIATVVAGVSAVVAALSALFSYRLSKGIYDEIKADEVLIVGKFHHPALKEREHRQCVLRSSIANKSNRKAYIDSVKVYDHKGKEIDITWSDSCDELGNIIKPTNLLGIESNTDLIFRRNDGQAFHFKTKIIIKHSFDSKYIEVFYDPLEDD